MIPARNPYDPHLINGVARITDETLAALLGLKSRRALRTKIKNNEADLSKLGDVLMVTCRLRAESSQFASFWLLNERQALFVASKSGSSATGAAIREVKAMLRKAARSAPKKAAAGANIIPINRNQEA